MMDLITVIVPVYNVEKYIDCCIKSLIAQTYKKIEIIVVDDGTKDQSIEICKKIQDNRIKIYQKENGGLSSARNFGIEHANGKYIAFVDSDDYVSETYIEKLYEAAKKYNADMVVGNVFLVDEGNSILANNDMVLKEGVYTPDEMNAFLYEDGGHFLATAWDKLYKKSLWEKLRYPVGKLREDEFVIHKLFYACERIACINDPIYFYRQNFKSIMNTFSIKHFAIFEAYSGRLEYYEQMGKIDLQIKAFVIICGIYSRYKCNPVYKPHIKPWGETLMNWYHRISANMTLEQKIRCLVHLKAAWLIGVKQKFDKLR